MFLRRIIENSEDAELDGHGDRIRHRHRRRVHRYPGVKLEPGADREAGDRPAAPRIAASVALPLDFFETARDYYATSRAYSETAFAGWRGDPKVGDEQFVIAAYQASQVYTFGATGANWASVFGGDRMRDIDSAAVRRSRHT